MESKSADDSKMMSRVKDVLLMNIVKKSMGIARNDKTSINRFVAKPMDLKNSN